MDDHRLSTNLPWLVYTHRNNGDEYDKSKDDVQTFSTAPFDSKASLKSFPILRGKSILGSQFGWLFLRDRKLDDTYKITLWNPFTLKSIEFPPLVHLTADKPGCYLTSPPPIIEGDEHCFLFLFFDGVAFSSRCRPTRRDDDCGGSGWVSKKIEIEDEAAMITKAVVLHGVIYGLAYVSNPNSRDRCLVRIDVVMADDDDDSLSSFTITTLSNITLPNTYFSRILQSCVSFMVESCGRIYMAQVGTLQCHYGVHAVKIFELDLGQGIWVEVKSLGDRAFLLGDNCCTWCWKSTEPTDEGGVEGNCVYFYHPDLVEDDVVLYHLDDCTTTFLPSPKLLIPRSDWPHWIMPPPSQGRESSRSIAKDTDVSNHCKWVTNPIDSCKDDNNNMETQENYLFELPMHLLELISRYMHLFDHWNFRCSSKIIQSAVQAPRCRKIDSLPLLLVFENDGGLCRLMDPCRNDTIPCILQLSHLYFDVEFSKNGWLLVFDGTSRFYFDPFTKVKIDLPPPTIRYYYQIGFSTHPTCSKCLTVAIKRSESRIIIDYLWNGDVEWSSCTFDDNTNQAGVRFVPGYCCPVYHSGAFYFLDEYGYLGVFTLVDIQDPNWIVYDKPFGKRYTFHSCHLVESDGELLSVFIDKMGKLVRVFRFNMSNKKWIRIKSLGNQTLFISPYSSSSMVAKEAETRNRIYLPCLSERLNGSTGIVYYSLETQQYRVHDDHQGCSNNFYFMKHPSRCYWV